MDKQFFYQWEIYTINPATGETGWDIKHRTVVAENMGDARRKLKQTPNFDCVILLNYRDVEVPSDFKSAADYFDCDYSELPKQ